ncbi:hypothetical protein (DUF295) [Arabidopsis thaliana]|uniref:KIB1-4 beta-propeller domain-containing protein n=1 Tax=Arabidopsis thaliana TaxID=3702 RepID=F4JL02_ARATH|nr:hypothetical protein (DUF295) [Arabidopsis thaliana]AEE83690.1 hypothetical protein (DUF295) [Arabidopsis thaliana]|eukprot:NP_193343.3 hypothetical protein (DUF295) [Arabidopsis thaliana]
MSTSLLIPQRCNTFRMFSSSTTNPFLLHHAIPCGEEAQRTEFLMLDPAKEDYFTTVDKPLPKNLIKSKLVGSSHGWGVYLSSPDYILISNYPSRSKSNPKIIDLPPRPSLNGSQTELVSGVAMSSSPEEEECIIAVKYMGRPVSIYTPGQDSQGFLLAMSTRLFDYFEQSKLMYSKRDQRFYMPSSGGHHLWSWVGLPSTTPQYHELKFHNLPQFSHSELQLFDSCYRAHELVESPSGQRFLLKWYVESPANKSLVFNCGGTKRFMVFREEEDMNMCYTEDIGDLCIFLGNNEPFCVKASSFPGLNPNSIYFLGEGYGVYDIATRSPRSFTPKSTPSSSSEQIVLPYWIPPMSL